MSKNKEHKENKENPPKEVEEKKPTKVEELEKRIEDLEKIIAKSMRILLNHSVSFNSPTLMNTKDEIVHLVIQLERRCLEE